MFDSQLHDEKTFYKAFIRDLESCRAEVIVESPYITTPRTDLLIPIFKKLLKNNVKIYIMTRNPKEHDLSMEPQAEEAIRAFENMGIQVWLGLGNHHRKLAILDQKVLWEGSLNILSQTRSREIMRRIEDEKTAKEMFDFLKLKRFM